MLLFRRMLRRFAVVIRDGIKDTGEAFSNIGETLAGYLSLLIFTVVWAIDYVIFLVPRLYHRLKKAMQK